VILITITILIFNIYILLRPWERVVAPSIARTLAENN